MRQVCKFVFTFGPGLDGRDPITENISTGHRLGCQAGWLTVSSSCLDHSDTETVGEGGLSETGLG
jgi:hypothetical protein